MRWPNWTSAKVTPDHATHQSPSRLAQSTRFCQVGWKSCKLAGHLFPRDARCQSASPFYNLLCCTNASLPKLFLQIYSTPGTSKQQIQCQICTTIANYSNNKHLNTIKCSQQFSSIGPLLCMDASLPHLFYQIQAQLFFYTISTLFGEEIRQRKVVVQYPHDVQAFAVLVSGI